MNHYGGVTKHDARDCAEVAKFPRFCPEMRITDLVVALGLVLARAHIEPMAYNSNMYFYFPSLVSFYCM